MKSCTLNVKNRKLIVCQSLLSVIVLGVAVALTVTVGGQFDGAQRNNRASISFSPSSSLSRVNIPFNYLRSTSGFFIGEIFPPPQNFVFSDETRPTADSIPIGPAVPAGDGNQNRAYNSFTSWVSQNMASFRSGSPSFVNGSMVYTNFNTSYAPVLERTDQPMKNHIADRLREHYASCQCSSQRYCFVRRCTIPASSLLRAGITFQEFTRQSIKYAVTPVQESTYRYDTSRRQYQVMEALQVVSSTLYRYALNYTFPSTDSMCILNSSNPFYSTSETFSASQPCAVPNILTFFQSYSAFVGIKFTLLLEMGAVVLSLMLPLPLFMYRIVAERASGMSSIIYQNGMRPFGYWFSNFLADFVLFFIVLIPVIIVGFAASFSLFVESTAAFWLSLLLMPFGLIPASYLLSLPFSSPARSTVFAYIWSFITFGGAFALNAAVMSPQISTPVWYLVYPPWILLRASWFTLFRTFFPDVVTEDRAFNEALADALGTVGFGMVLMLIVVWLDSFLPKKGSGIRSPFTICCQCGKGSANFEDDDGESVELEHLVSSSPDIEASAALGMFDEDEEVREERKTVMGKKYSKDSPVVVSNVTKVWPGRDKHMALDHVCLHLDQNFVFGLLGPNGAGKSTLIKIMTGEEVPTHGRVFIGGRDVTKNPEKTSSIIGLCPQFDVLWDDMTVEEHLLFYARLKGVPRHKERDRVKSLITDVGLDGEVNRLASALSGGQKRRLSIGIALAGNPSVVFLDEPSTGLDPATRRGLWDTLAELRKGRCFLLTTHLMEEAEVLCSRIGILSRGKLKCLGDKQRLKALYGTGYKIDISADVANHERIHTYITSTVPSATLVTKSPVSLVYRCQDLILSEIFGEIERNKARYGMRNWAVSQSSLDDVFVRIVREDENLNDEIPAPPTKSS